MNYHVHITHRAEHDLNRALDYIEFSLKNPQAADSLLEGLLLTIIIVLVLCLLFAIAVRSASKGALARTPLVLKEAARRDDGFTSGADLNYFLGHEGVVTTMLRPVGTADFDGVKLEVLAEGECIEAGARVRVVKVEGRKIVVCPV